MTFEFYPLTEIDNTEWRTKKETEILMAYNLRNIMARKIIFTQSDRKFSKVFKNVLYAFHKPIFGEKTAFLILFSGHKKLKIN